MPDKSISADKELQPADKAFEWPFQAMRNRQWVDSAYRWAVLRKAFPQHPATWFQGIDSYLKAGRYKSAKLLIDKAKSRFPNHPSILILSAQLFLHQGNTEKSETLLRKARQKHAYFLDTWLTSAQIAEQLGMLDRAAKYYNKACQCRPDRPSPFIEFAEFYMRTGQWELALERWKMLRNAYPQLSNGYLRAADAARQLGQSKFARQLSLSYYYGQDIFKKSTIAHKIHSQNIGWSKIIWFLNLIWTKALYNLRSEVHRNYLSYGWWILEPLLHMTVFYVVFDLLLKRGGENFPVFLLAGLIPWMWFMKVISNCSASILLGQNLILQVGIPSIIFPLVSFVQATLKQIPAFLLLFAFVIAQGFTFGSHWWALVPVVLVQLLLTIAIACSIAAIIPFIRDLTFLVPTGLTFMMLLSGIFYDYRGIYPKYQDLFLLNPMAFLLTCYRDIIMKSASPDFVSLTKWGIGSLFLCVFVFSVYRRLRYVFPRIIME